MLVIKFACTRAFVRGATIVSTIVLSLFQTGQATGATCRSTKHDMTLQLLCQFIEPPEKCLNVWVLCEPSSVLFQPCPDLSNPRIGNGDKVLIKNRNPFIFRVLESTVMAFPTRSQSSETCLRCNRCFGIRDIENNRGGWSKNGLVCVHILRINKRQSLIPKHPITLITLRGSERLSGSKHPKASAVTM